MNVTNIPEVAYDCVYKFESAYTSKPLTANRESNDTIRCPLPPTNDLPTFTEGDWLDKWMDGQMEGWMNNFMAGMITI